MSKNDQTIVCNLYKDGGADDNPLDLEATYRDEYIDPEESDEYNYFQFGLDLPDGQYLEIRLDVQTLSVLLQSLKK